MKDRIRIAAALSGAILLSLSARAEMEANIGWASEYIFRGTFQEDSSAFAGIDYTAESGFYAGTWAADVGDGLESDVYLGITGGDRVTWKVGYTGYFYTDDFDDTYNELNLGLGYGLLTVDVAAGRWEGFGDAQDYLFSTLTVDTPAGIYFRIGHFGRDFDGTYLESGYAWTLEDHDLDLSITLVGSDELNVSDGDDGEDGDVALVFGIKKRLGLTR